MWVCALWQKAEGVMAARAVVVMAAGRTDAFAGAGSRVEHALALVAPPQAALLFARRVFPAHDRVMVAPAIVVMTAGRTDALSGAGSGVEETLALVAPPPAALPPGLRVF